MPPGPRAVEAPTAIPASPVATAPTVGLMLSTVAGDGPSGPARVTDAARRAEDGGFDAAYVGDHLLHPRPLLESVVTLSMVAASTTRISFGPCVMLIALRDPLLLAKQLGTLATFAPGRLRVGVGVGGEYPDELAAAGVPTARRGRAMEAALEEVRALLAAGFDHPDLTMGPTGRDVPFLIGARKEVALRRAARCADGWIGYLLDVDGFSRRRDLVLGYREELGRAGRPFAVAMLLPVHVDPTRTARASAARAWSSLTGSSVGFPEELFVAGSAEDVAEQLHRYRARGCDELVLAVADQGDGYLGQVDVLAGEVLPRLRSFA